MPYESTSVLGGRLGDARRDSTGVIPGAGANRPKVKIRDLLPKNFPNVGHLFNQGRVAGEPGTPEWEATEKEIQWKKSINRGYQKYLTTTK
jgi:hypothetical protein